MLIFSMILDERIEVLNGIVPVIPNEGIEITNDAMKVDLVSLDFLHQARDVPSMGTVRQGILGFTTVLVGIACERPGQPIDNSGIEERLDKIEARLGNIEKEVKEVGKAAAKPKRPSRPRPDANAVYSVPLGESAYSGPEHAKVTIVEAFEFACPFCDRVRGTIKQLANDYGNDLKIVYKNYVVHPSTATTPALAACAAGKQGKYSEMMELIWEKGFKANRNLAAENMEKLAKEAKLDMTAYKRDMDGPCKGELSADRKALSAVGVTGTPAFFINGRFLSGARPIDQFKAVIDEELKKANKALESGTSLENYYAEYVEKKGKKKL